MPDNFNSIEITSDTVYLTISGNWTGSFAIEESFDGNTWASTYNYLPGIGLCTLRPYLSKYLRARPVNVTGNPIIQWGAPMNQQEKQRVQFDFTPEAIARLNNLQEKLDVPTKAEVIRTSFKVLEWLLTLDEESIMEIQDKDGNMQYRMPVKGVIL